MWAKLDLRILQRLAVKSKTIALQYFGQKSSRLSPKPRVRKLVSQLFLCFLELLGRFSPPFFVLAVFFISGFYLTINNYVFSDHYEPENHSKNQRLKPLRNSRMYVARSLMCEIFGHVGRDPFSQNFRKFRSKTQWIGSVQPQKFRKNWSTF